VGFPSHGLLVRPHRAVVGHSGIVRGIRDPVQLAEAIRLACRDSGDERALVETDMRAHMNPTRMASIRTLAFRLVRRLRTACPACGTPGWGRVRSESGLPCSWCGGPTDLTSCDIFGCAGCDHEERFSRSDGLLHADPGQCPRCNP
jgi:hypothetical protein